MIFTLILILEFFTKITAYGFTSFYKASLFNQYDTYVVLLSTLDVLVANAFIDDEMNINSWGITILRAFRIIRIFKLARYWRGFQLLLETLWRTLQNAAAFGCLLFCIIFIYTLIGLEFFSNRAKFDHASQNVDLVHGESPMFNFDNFLSSFTIVFVILTNDNQSVFYYNFYRAVSSSKATLFWITFIIVAQKIMLNVFLAILLENFNEGSVKNKIYE
jgi:Ion transport protein